MRMSSGEGGLVPMSEHSPDLRVADPEGRLDRWVVRIGNVMSILFLVGVVISVFEVVSRYLFHAPTAWVHESTILIVGLCLIFGGAHCLATNQHIRITLVYEALPPRYRRL
ncbi:MAG: TRAP transporter small permease subunit, partial [Rhodospirillales bacterium]|nr:TRAP transporter small permease subunit [Rhodospirillales bacterium]